MLSTLVFQFMSVGGVKVCNLGGIPILFYSSDFRVRKDIIRPQNGIHLRQKYNVILFNNISIKLLGPLPSGPLRSSDVYYYIYCLKSINLYCKIKTQK